MRPGSTYRGARFLVDGAVPITVAGVDKGFARRIQVMAQPVYRPVQSKGWDWRKGGRAARDAEKANECRPSPQST